METPREVSSTIFRVVNGFVVDNSEISDEPQGCPRRTMIECTVEGLCTMGEYTKIILQYEYLYIDTIDKDWPALETVT